jgi:hypothetical protein
MICVLVPCLLLISFAVAVGLLLYDRRSAALTLDPT